MGFLSLSVAPGRGSSFSPAGKAHRNPGRPSQHPQYGRTEPLKSSHRRNYVETLLAVAQTVQSVFPMTRKNNPPPGSACQPGAVTPRVCCKRNPNYRQWPWIPRRVKGSARPTREEDAKTWWKTSRSRWTSSTPKTSPIYGGCGTIQSATILPSGHLSFFSELATPSTERPCPDINTPRPSSISAGFPETDPTPWREVRQLGRNGKSVTARTFRHHCRQPRVEVPAAG